VFGKIRSDDAYSGKVALKKALKSLNPAKRRFIEALMKKNRIWTLQDLNRMRKIYPKQSDIIVEFMNKFRRNLLYISAGEDDKDRS
jgi:hypothetical protein